MTEAEARAALRAFVAVGYLERWIAEQRPWQTTPGGWTVPGELQGESMQNRGGGHAAGSAAPSLAGRKPG